MNLEPTTYAATDRHRHVERLDAETLVYDTASDQVLRLAPDAAAVWDVCAADVTVSAIVAQTGIGAARVDQALSELASNGLVAAHDPGGLTRRSFAAKAGLGVAAVAGAVLVTSMVAPSAASAQSAPPGGGGGGDN